MNVGIDSVEIERIKKSIQSPSFLSRIYSEKELLALKDRPAQSYAGNFAAKEAFSKAVGTGMSCLRWKDISVLRDSKGAPYLELTGAAESAVNGRNFTVSITHTVDTATAIVIIYD